MGSRVLESFVHVDGLEGDLGNKSAVFWRARILDSFPKSASKPSYLAYSSKSREIMNDKNKLNSRVTFILAACAMLFSGAQAWAQGAADSLALEEIVVTARRVEENLQDVPTAISAFQALNCSREGRWT